MIAPSTYSGLASVEFQFFQFIGLVILDGIIYGILYPVLNF